MSKKVYKWSDKDVYTIKRAWYASYRRVLSFLKHYNLASNLDKDRLYQTLENLSDTLEQDKFLYFGEQEQSLYKSLQTLSSESDPCCIRRSMECLYSLAPSTNILSQPPNKIADHLKRAIAACLAVERVLDDGKSFIYNYMLIVLICAVSVCFLLCLPQFSSPAVLACVSIAYALCMLLAGAALVIGLLPHDVARKLSTATLFSKKVEVDQKGLEEIHRMLQSSVDLMHPKDRDDHSLWVSLALDNSTPSAATAAYCLF